MEPPARLIAYAETDWLPLVNPTDYDPEDYKNRGSDGPYGPPRWTFDAWRRQQAFNLWSHARLNWCSRYGWPGGLDALELLQETVRLRRAEIQLAAGDSMVTP